ncbi:uncharacterized protein LOC110852908 isoform X3 [Folsomia candida]|nr:uncharacterized protein LOC110852908 isoform X3 [Folsomia candida]
MRRNEPLLSYHRFPTTNIHRNVRQKWIEVLSPILPEETFPSDLSKYEICSRHFKSKDFSMREIGKSYLLATALPSEHLGDKSFVTDSLVNEGFLKDTNAFGIAGISRPLSPSQPPTHGIMYDHHRCVIANCRRRYLNEPSSIPLYALKSTWIPFVRTSNGDMSWQPPKCAEMCALHFEDNMFRDTGRQRLEEWAFPTSSSPSPSPRIQAIMESEPKIPKTCCVPSCSLELRGADTSYHCFPGHKLHHKIRNEWIRIIRGLICNQEWEPNGHKICSRHFVETDFRTDAGLKKSLKVSAVPAVNLYHVTDPCPNDELVNGLTWAYDCTCVVPSCKSFDRRREVDLSWHRFSAMPIHRHIRAKWITIIRNLRNDQTWEPAINSRICSRHFRKEELRMGGSGRFTLNGQSVPTLFLHDATMADPNSNYPVDFAPSTGLTCTTGGTKQRNCAVPSCTSIDRKREVDLSWHMFSTMASHRQMRNKWITIIRNLRNDQKWEPAIDSRICSRHFLKEKFYMAGNRRRLIGQSAPTLFLRGATTDVKEELEDPLRLDNEDIRADDFVRCTIPNCPNNLNRPNPSETMFSFRDEDARLRPGWIQTLRAALKTESWNPDESDRICSIHFAEEQIYFNFLNGNWVKQVKGTPTLNLRLPNPTPTQGQKTNTNNKCIIPGCDDNSLRLRSAQPCKSRPIWFHKFKDSWSWIMRKLLKNPTWTAPPNSEICYLHFVSSDLHKSSGSLLSSAIPKLNLGCDFNILASNYQFYTPPTSGTTTPNAKVDPVPKPQQPTSSALRICSEFTSMCRRKFPSHFQNPATLPVTQREKEIASKLLDTFIRLQDENGSSNPGEWQQIHFDSFIDESVSEQPHHHDESTNSSNAPHPTIDDDDSDVFKVIHFDPPAHDTELSSNETSSSGPPGILTVRPSSPMSPISDEQESTDPTSYRPAEKLQAYLPPDDLRGTDFTTQVIQGIRHASAKSSHLQKNPVSHYRKKPGRKTPLTPRLL